MDDITTPNWQDWLAQLTRGLSAEGWLAVADAMGSAHVEKALRGIQATILNVWVNRLLADTLLLAALQLPEAQALAEIDNIARLARQARYERSPKAVPRRLRDMYRESTSAIQRLLPDAADVLASVFTRYLRGEVDLQGDSNLLMRACQRALAARDRAAALDAIGRAGAAALRGARLWRGWLHEGEPEFRQWALVLITSLDEWKGFLPLGPAAEARARAGEIARALPRPQLRQANPGETQEDAGGEPAWEVAGRALMQDDNLGEEWMALLQRDQPLSDEEIAAMGDRYHALTALAAQAIQLGFQGTSPTGTLSVAATTLGILRDTDPESIGLLIELVADAEQFAEYSSDGDDDQFEFDLVDDAVVALQRIGNPVVPAVIEFLRYSVNTEARYDLLHALGVAGRGSEDAFQYVAAEFANTAWANDKSDLAIPLAWLHDARAVPIFVEALRAPALTSEDAWKLLDALQELGVALYVNRDTRSVNIPDYGIIEDILPADWKSREEFAAEEEVFGADDFDEDDEDDDEDDDDALEGEDYGDVIYDSQGIPRCPDCGAEMYYEAGQWRHAQTPPAAAPIVGRNDPCPCGSGKKYKHCHGKGL